jgi:hypothetical protein
MLEPLPACRIVLIDEGSIVWRHEWESVVPGGAGGIRHRDLP